MSRKSKSLVCPKCESDSIEEWTIGLVLPPPEGHDHDPNKKICHSCGYEWFKICPSCDYKQRSLSGG